MHSPFVNNFESSDFILFVFLLFLKSIFTNSKALQIVTLEEYFRSLSQPSNVYARGIFCQEFL